MTNWPMVRFDELAAPEKSSFSKPYGSAYTTDDYVKDGIPVVRGVNLADGTFHDDDFVFITEDKANQLPGANLTPGDLVITHRGTIGQISMIPRLPRYSRYVLSTSQVKARLNEDIAVPEFYYYWFRSPYGQHEILKHVSTVGVPGLAQPVATVKSMRVPRPPIDEQKRIADVLKSFDEKITLNNQLHSTTNALASSIYESTISCSAAETVPVGQVASVNARATRPSDGYLRYIDISSVGEGYYSWPERMPWETAPGRARRKAQAGDTIWSTVRPNRRSHALVLDNDDDLVFSTGLAVLSPDKIGPALLFEATKTPEFQEYLERVSEGSTYPAVRADLFGSAPLILPNPDLRERLEGRLMTLRKRAHQAAVESRSLTATRDTLIGQIMTGKLRVHDAKS